MRAQASLLVDARPFAADRPRAAQADLISGDQNGNIRVWDLTANACSRELCAVDSLFFVAPPLLRRPGCSRFVALSLSSVTACRPDNARCDRWPWRATRRESLQVWRLCIYMCVCLIVVLKMSSTSQQRWRCVHLASENEAKKKSEKNVGHNS